jgi:type III pantothenate kinase
MLLAVDVGNTQTHLGVFKRTQLVHEWRASTEPKRTADELALLFGGFLDLVDLSFSTEITGVAIASVVPRATQQLREMTFRYFGFQPVVVEPGTRTGVSVLTDNPREVGADRITNAVAAHELYQGEAVIVVDFGTAINFDVVTKDGNYIGGALAPGIESSATALFTATARLPRVELVAPESPIGKNTVAAVQSGILYGAAGLVDGIVERLKNELGTDARVVATGGMADVVAPHCRSVDGTEPNLTLVGLRMIFDRNTEAAAP